jgi:hypothetical protein
MTNLQKLISLVNKGFFAQNLSELIRACEQTLEAKENVLVVFTLKGLFLDLYDFYDNPPVTDVRAKVLTTGLRAKILELLNNVGKADIYSLEEIITLYQCNKAKLKKQSRQ